MAEIDINDIRKNYERMSDFQIERIATENAKGLRYEVFGIIEEEIKKRNLDPKLLEQAMAQNKEYSIDQIENFSKVLQNLPCPICRSKTKKLNGTFSYTVKSFIFFTSQRMEISVACPTCLDKINSDAMISTAILGWWGIPWGIFKTPLYIYRNFKQKTQNNLEFPNEALFSFSFQNASEIEVYINDQNKLINVIKRKAT